MKYRSKKFICIIISVMILLSSFSLGISAAIDTSNIVNGGEYYIKNTASNLYLNAFDSLSLNQASFSGTSAQTWIFTEFTEGYYANLGYYTIMNKATGTYLIAPAEPEDGALVSVESYIPVTSSNEYERQIWRFIELENGKCLIQSRSMDTSYGFYLSHGTMGIYGYDVMIDPYWPELSDYAYYLEWEIHDYTTDDFDYRLLAYNEPYLCYCSNEISPCTCDDTCPCQNFPDEDPCTACENRDLYLDPTADLLYTYKGHLNKSISTYFYKEMSKTIMADLLTDCELFIIHTHGAQNYIQIDSTNTDNDFFCIEDFNNLDLSNLKLAVLLTCSTAEGYDENNIALDRPTNIVEKMICQDAETVIGFAEPTLITDCNDFAYSLMEKIASGKTVSAAIQLTKNDKYEDANFGTYIVVAGNENLTLG